MLDSELKSRQRQLDMHSAQLDHLKQQLRLERDLSADRLKTIHLLEEQISSPPSTGAVVSGVVTWVG